MKSRFQVSRCCCDGAAGTFQISSLAVGETRFGLGGTKEIRYSGGVNDAVNLIARNTDGSQAFPFFQYNHPNKTPVASITLTFETQVDAPPPEVKNDYIIRCLLPGTPLLSWEVYGTSVTGANVAWTQSGTDWDPPFLLTTPDLSGPVNAIINDAGYTGGDPILIFIEPDPPPFANEVLGNPVPSRVARVANSGVPISGADIVVT